MKKAVGTESSRSKSFEYEMLSGYRLCAMSLAKDPAPSCVTLP